MPPTSFAIAVKPALTGTANDILAAAANGG